MAFKPWCDPCKTWHTEAEGHPMSERELSCRSDTPLQYMR
jgi:hypothetical protein